MGFQIPGPPRPEVKASWWWRILAIVRQLWNKAADAGYAPEKGQGDSRFGDGGQSGPRG